MKLPCPRPITVFTPSDGSASNTNAQNLTVKEIVARLPPDQFRVTLFCDADDADPRLAARPNTNLVPWRRHGNTIRLLRHCLFPPPDIYFFPRTGPLDRVFFDLKKYAHLKSALVSYIVMAMNPLTSRGMIGRSIREGDRVVANSKHVSETVHQMFGVDTSVVYDGIDRRFFFPADRHDKPATAQHAVVVLYAGSFQSRKRVEQVVQQAARLPRVQFRLAGKGETEAACRELAACSGCQNVSFLGHLTPAQLGEEMRRADIFLFPSVLEGNPQVLLQAGASGLVSIAMNVCHSDYVLHGCTGFLVETDDELAEALDRVVQNAALRHELSAAAIRHTEQFSWDRIAEQWGAIFREAAALRVGSEAPARRILDGSERT
jgi:glycosyltransferase involved in cell wall biosynthesis